MGSHPFCYQCREAEDKKNLWFPAGSSNAGPHLYLLPIIASPPPPPQASSVHLLEGPITVGYNY